MTTDIAGLRQKRAEKVDRMEQLVSTAGAEDRDMTEAEATAYDELKVEVEALGKSVKRAEEVQVLKGGLATPIRVTESQTTERSRKKAEDKPGHRFARIVRALVAERGNPRNAALFARDTWGDEEVAKALGAGVGSAGGFIVPEEYSAEIIELLRPASVVMSMSPILMPMPRGNISIPKLASGASAGYIGENQNLPKTEPTFGQLMLTARKLAALVPMSNDLVRFSTPRADEIVRDDIVASMSQRMDLAFIRGDGTGFSPKGLRYWTPSTNLIPANGTVNLTNVTVDLGKAILALQNANVRMLRPGWLMAPRTERYLMDVRDGNGNFAFRPEMLLGRLNGFPYRVTTQIPTNLGGGGNESEVYLVDFADAVVGDVMEIILDTSTEAAYHDGANVVAAFSLDQTVVRAIAQHDFGMRHDASVAVLSAVTWGAA